MAKRRFLRRPPEGLCTALEAEDGIDPRLAPKRSEGRVTNRKTLQLCRQVERILAGALHGEVLRDLTVHSVVPAPDSSRLLVNVVYHGGPEASNADVLATLHEGHAQLRREVTLGIHRRKTPDLTFQVLRGS